MKLYEYAVIYNPAQTQQQKDAGELPKSELVVKVTPCLARDDKQAQMLAARAIPDDYTDKLDRLEVVIRPF